MIGVEGQYVFKFSIGDKKDFIYEGNLDYFTLIEEAGNLLPVFQMSFRISDDEEILNRLNEGNNIEVGYGKTEPERISILKISKLEITRVGDGQKRIGLVGVYSSIGYISNHNLNITDKISGVEAIKQVAEKYFETDFNINKSSGSQNWIQPNTTDKKFINEIWSHSYIPDSFITVGITSEGVFKLRDFRKMISEDPEWKFTFRPTDNEKDINYSGDYTLSSNIGFLNYWLGYGRKQNLYNIEKGTESSIEEDSEALLANTQNLSRSSEVSKRFSDTGFINDNVHSNYNRAYLKNLINLSVFSSYSLFLSYNNEFYPIELLDLVTVKDDSSSGPRESSDSYLSGEYVITKIIRSLSSSKEYTTTVELNRESINELRGELK